MLEQFLIFLQSEISIFFQIVLIDIVLAADNAIIIGMLASSFPPLQRKKILFWGIAAAVIFRILFTLLAVYLLQIDGLRFIGGLILFWVIYKLYKDVILDNKASRPKLKKKKLTLFNAIVTVALADISLSLDNVLGVAGAAKNHYGLLIFGLLLAILLMATAANYISKIISKHMWIAWLGLISILYVAIQLIYSDFEFINRLINF